MKRKRCTKCREMKPLECFSKDRQRKSGLHFWCQECYNIYAETYRREHREQLGVKSKEYYRAHQEEAYLRQKKYLQTSAGKRVRKIADRKALTTEVGRTKRQARTVVGNAVRAGKLVRPSACAQCGRTPKRGAMRAHHEDYSKPLDIIWLCPLCDKSRHTGEKQCSQTT